LKSTNVFSFLSHWWFSVFDRQTTRDTYRVEILIPEIFLRLILGS
jgi:hypothetical protein